MANRPSVFNNEFFDAGVPAAGYKLYTYDSGTTTPKATYTDQAGTIPNTNPITLDADGMCELWLGTGEYTLALYTGLIGSGGALVKTWDDVAASASSDDLAALVTRFASTSQAADGAGMVGFSASLNYVAGTLGAAVKAKGLTVKDFGAVGDGTTDDSAAIRSAFDNMAAGSAASVGGQTYFPPGVYYCPTVVYIPRSNGPQTIYGHGAIIRGAGAGVGTIFETAQGTASTAGVSSFGTNELYLHYNTIIDGLKFENCEFALKLNNFLQGCVVRNCGTVDNATVKTLLYTRRCFYASVLNNAMLSAYDPAVTADTDACFRFENNNNGMVIMGNSALRSANTKGSGFHFSAGTAGVIFHGNTAERCRKGAYIGGAVYGMSVKANYFEGNAIDLAVSDGNYKRGLNVDENWFKSAIAIQAVAWQSGELGPGNHFNGAGAVTMDSTLGADGALNSLTVYLPRAAIDETEQRTALTIPANWLLNGSIIVKRQSSVYLAGSGPASRRALLSESCLGPTMLAAHNFVGDPGLAAFYNNGGIPYCTVVNNTNPGPGTIVVTTQIAWDTYAVGARFDFVVLDSITTYRICGWVSGTTVFRDDALVNTCVASIASGKLVLTLGNFTLGDIAGGVRII